VLRDPGQKVAAAQYAGLLRHWGDVDRALVYYGEGMYYQECRWSLPPAPRDAAEVDFRCLTAEELAEQSIRAAPAFAFAPAQLTAEWP
jgi:hypothetical protein